MFKRNMLGGSAGFGSQIVTAAFDPPDTLEDVAEPEPEPKQETVTNHAGELLVSELFAIKYGALTAELREMREMLINSQISLNNQHAEFFAQVKAERDAVLSAKHIAVREAGRKQQAAVAELEIVYGRAENELNRCIKQRSQCVANAKGTKSERNSLDRFASDADIKSANGRAAKAATALGEARNDEEQALEALNIALANLNGAKREIRRLSEEEARLRNALAGKEMVDSETGLTGVPEIA
jgi:hypothetical protein